MKKMNKKISLALLSLGLLAFAPSSASAIAFYGNNGCNPCCDPCQTPSNDCCNFGPFEVAVDFLWWKTCVDDLDLGYSLDYGCSAKTDEKRFHYKTICPDWEPGVRAILVKPDFWCNWILEASYTWIQPSESKSFTRNDDGFVYSTLSDFDTADNAGDDIYKISGDWKAKYQTFDVLLGYPIEFCQCQHFTPYFGLAGLFIDQSLNSHGYLFDSNDKFNTHWQSDLWALGLKLGTCYEYSFNECIKFFTNGSVTIVAGDATNHNSSKYQERDTSPHDFHNKYHDAESCHCIPGWHLQAGALYETCWCNWELFFRVGYEFVQWYNVPNARRFFNADSEFSDAFEGRSTSPSTSEFGFNGLFLGAGLKF